MVRSSAVYNVVRSSAVCHACHVVRSSTVCYVKFVRALYVMRVMWLGRALYVTWLDRALYVTWLGEVLYVTLLGRALYVMSVTRCMPCVSSTVCHECHALFATSVTRCIPRVSRAVCHECHSLRVTWLMLVHESCVSPSQGVMSYTCLMQFFSCRCVIRCEIFFHVGARSSFELIFSFVSNQCCFLPGQYNFNKCSFSI